MIGRKATMHLSADVEDDTVSRTEHLRALSGMLLSRSAAQISRSSIVTGPATWPAPRLCGGDHRMHTP